MITRIVELRDSITDSEGNPSNKLLSIPAEDLEFTDVGIQFNAIAAFDYAHAGGDSYFVPFSNVVSIRSYENE